MYLILVKEGKNWVVHTKTTKEEEELWSETEAIAEIKSLIGRGHKVKAFKAERVNIGLSLVLAETG